MEEQNRQPYTYGNNPEHNAGNDKQANQLCIISLACTFLPMIISGILMSVVYAVTDSGYSDIADFVMNILATVIILGIIAGIALMIYVRVKYPRNTFGKVLMWLYIVLAILAIIVFILYMLLALVACISCISCLQNMPG